MPRCLTKLNSSEKQADLDQSLFFSDFSDELQSYYQGTSKYPDIDLLVSEINSQILPQFISGNYSFDDLLETVQDPENALALKNAFGKLLSMRRQINLKADVPPYHADRKFDIVDKLIDDLQNKIEQNEASAEEQSEQASSLDSSVVMDKIDDSAPQDNYVHERNYANLQAYRLDRFKGSSSIESITVSKFIREGLLKNAFIDVDRGVLVNQKQEPKKPSEIDTNLKNYRKNLLANMIERLNLYDTTNDQPTKLEYSDALLTYNGFNKALRIIADSVMQVRYKNELVSLESPGKLFEITEDYKRTQSPELKNIVDNFSDYVILSDFNKLFDYYGEGTIAVNKYNDDFDGAFRKYSIKDALSIDAINAMWDEKVQNGVELASPLYKTIINNTPIVNYTTGKETGKFLYPTLVASTFATYFDKIDRFNHTESIRSILIDSLRDKTIPRTDKNILYTLYKSFYERDGDPVVVDTKSDGTPKRNFNTKVASFHNTIRDNRDQSLMLLISKPLMETAKAYYLEAVEGFDGQAKLSNSNVRDKTAVTFTSSRYIASKVNMSNDALFGTDEQEDPGFLRKYDVRFVHDDKGSRVLYKSPSTGTEYELTNQGAKVYDIGTIRELSKDLLGLDFDNDRRHAEFWEEMQSLADEDNQIPPVYLQYLKDAFDVVEAKSQLYDTETYRSIREAIQKGKDSVSNYELINRAARNDRNFFSKMHEYQFPLNTQNAKVIDELLYTAENNYTGNRLKSVTPTVEGTTVAGFSKYNYSLGLKQNLMSHRRVLSSVNRRPFEKSPLQNNIFFNDPDALDNFFIRGAAKIGDVAKGNSSQTDLETMIYNINLGYFQRLRQAIDDGSVAKPVFDTLVFSDKSVNPLAAVNNDVLRPTGRVSLFLADSRTPVGEDFTKQLLYETSGQYYRAQAQNILDTWQSVFEAAGHGDTFKQEVLPKKLLSTQLKALNELNETKANFWKSTDFEHGLKGYEAARYFADKAGVALNNWIHYNNSTKSLGPRTKLTIKDDLINNVGHYDRNSTIISDGFTAKYERELVNFANELLDMGFKFDSTASSTIKKLYPDLAAEHGGGEMPEVLITARNARAERASDVNPALRKFFWDHNLVRENLTNVAQGSAYAHKGNDENKQQLTQNKRNVNMTATVTNYTLGLENGVEDSTRTAFVDDSVKYGKNILGDTKEIVVYDGASFETMTQRLKTWNSLNAKFSGNGGLVHKSFISHYDPTDGSFGETKHAAFAMTNDMIRQSKGTAVDLYELHKQLYSTDISKVDITKPWKRGVNLSSFDDVYYYDRGIDVKTGLMGTLYKLDSIVHDGFDEDGNSKYIVTTRNMSLDPGKPIKTPQRINTMFDLWNILGGIDSVEMSEEKTNMFYKDGKNTVYVTDIKNTQTGKMPVTTSAEKLLDYESYIGNEGDSIVPSQYISGGNNSVVKGYNVYKQLFNTDGVVNAHSDAIRDYINTGNATQLALALKGHDTKLGIEALAKSIDMNKDNLLELLDSVDKQVKDGTALVRPYQRFKGKNIDRISFAGAQKVGQYNLNSIETVHKPLRDAWLQNHGHENDPGIPGMTRLMTHQISNFNAGIQLNAWHETEASEVTTPTQMLNALIFNAKKLGKVQEMYSAIGNIVDKELTYLLGRDTHNIPQLVQGLSNKDFYAQNKDTLLRIFKDILDTKVNTDKDAEFTLERIIVDMFNHKDFPVDDSQIFHSAVAELTNYFTKTGIRTKFDGMFAVLAPASDILQVHEVRGGFMPIKNELGGYDRVKLQPGETRILQPFEFEQYAKLNRHLAENDHDDQVRLHASTATNSTELSRQERQDRALKAAEHKLLRNYLTDNYVGAVPLGKDASREDVSAAIKEAFNDNKYPSIDSPTELEDHKKLGHTLFDVNGKEITPEEVMEKAHEYGTQLSSDEDISTLEGSSLPKLLKDYQTGKIPEDFRASAENLLREHGLGSFLTPHDENQLDLFANTTDRLSNKPRDLKGQQVVIRYADGSTEDLSILNNGEVHQIPEARALDIAKTHITDFKDFVDSKEYKKLPLTARADAMSKQYELFLKKFDELRQNHPEIEHSLRSFETELSTLLNKPAKGNSLEFAYNVFSQSKDARDAKLLTLRRDSQPWVWEMEHEYLDRINTVGKLFVGRLQKFLDDADRGYTDETGELSHIPQSLHNPALFRNAHLVKDAKIEISRAECLAPITMAKAFLLREGDSIHDVNVDFFQRRLNEGLDYLNVNADAMLLSKSGKRIFLHKGNPQAGTKATQLHENVRTIKGRTYFTNDSGDRLFQVPDGIHITNINGGVHAFIGKHDLANNDLIDNLNRVFGREGDKFEWINLGSKESRALEKAKLQAVYAQQAKEMYSSWKVYIDGLIGSRVPGQHFQSFQGMKIVGFVNGNNVHTAKEIIDLSGADFDIDKQNIIYHSINDDGRMAVWHPASDLSTPELLQQSMKLPMPSKRTAEFFTTEKTSLGDTIDKTIGLEDMNDLSTEPSIADLLGVYHLINQGYKFDADTHPNWIAKLVEYENEEVGLNAVKNFAAASTNEIIGAPSNFLYLSNGVSTDTIKEFSNRTSKAELANKALKENPHSQSRQKEENMVGKTGIGIMASQMKVLSTIQYATNTTLNQLSEMSAKHERLTSLLENYKYHAANIANTDSLYTGPHTLDQLKQGINEVTNQLQQLNEESNYLRDAIGGRRLSLPNLNYDLLNEMYEKNQGMFQSLHRTSSYADIRPDKQLQWAKLAQAFDTDVADLDSQLLSSSTDNAKELDLGKINATPDLMTIMPSMGLKGASFGEMIDVMTSPLSNMFLRNATKNVYDKRTAKNSLSNLLSLVDAASAEKASDKKARAIDDLDSKYNLEFHGDHFVDKNTKEVYGVDEIKDFNNKYYKPAQAATLLAGYLSINQGIPSNNWDLFNFSTRLENAVRASTRGELPFNFKRFLDSLSNNGTYHKQMISAMTPLYMEQGLNYNPLYVLSVNPHFAKQLSAFNAANTMLRETSYRVNAVYHMTEKLRDMGYLGQFSNLKKSDFGEVERFIESTIIDSFIKNEATNNKNSIKERPIIYTKDGKLNLADSDDRAKFLKWVQTDFMRDLNENPALRGNPFTQDLRLDSKDDQLYFDKVDFMKLQMDTTNVKTNLEQGPFRDAYIAGLKDIYDNDYTDLHNNNIFNTLFWYNLIVNKNNITKNSYAKLLGDVMWKDGPAENVYSRLLLLKGKIGKSTDAQLNLEAKTDTPEFWRMHIAGIEFNLKDLFLMHEVGNQTRLAAARPEEQEQGEYEEMPEDYSDDVGGFDDDTDFGTPDEGGVFDSDDQGGEDVYDDYEEDQEKKKRNIMDVERIKQKGVPGTLVRIKVNDKAEETRVNTPSIALPVSKGRNTDISKDLDYNPFVQKTVELRPDQNQSYNYYKMAITNIHDLLSRLGEAVTIEIKQGDKDFEAFDRNKNYDC